MLILPPGHAQTVRTRRQLSPLEKWILRSVAAVVAVILLIVIIALAASGKASGHGCIYATIPAATGTQDISECGVQARSTCGSLNTPGAYTKVAAQELAPECRKAGLPTGR